MLLPSALPCDSSQRPPLTRLQAALFASPPASPPQLSTQTAIGNIFSTCRSLQTLLTNSAQPIAISNEPITPPTSSHANLPTPPLAHAPAPPLKLRLRSRKTDTPQAASATGDHGPARKRIVKRVASVAQQPPARGPNKRRRAADDDMGRYNNNHNNHEDDDSSDGERDAAQPAPPHGQDKENNPHEPGRPHTPKRSRIAPEVLPLGLERSDYHHLNPERAGPAAEGAGTDVEIEADGEPWSTEEDRMLVELVLEKLKLTKSDWQDCARSLGKDRSSVGRRWKSLMVNGDVGLKRGSRARGRIHGTWR
ncbi:hypothetical protein C8A05DRAFT_29277 [Staphylotrichum tortipilum]|uniref:Myb-like domain-containing protein n=1 Tax=Staphylotrichum tortipilum TaxID=2831512 RepID=A0AAN6MTK6_9PEZI|nr:hypothetical protein C8A05DRAFT_29277 [Staphylotrichum longicolle]